MKRERFSNEPLYLMIMKVFKKIISKFSSRITPKYKIGNIKKHNTHVDTLIPQYVTIGDNFISAPGSIILAHDASTLLHSGKYRVEKTVIGDNVFLGAGAIVLPGVNIGCNVIVGAGSVVSKNIRDGVVVAGNPAKELCTIDEYISKCNERGVLFEPPQEFLDIFNGGIITQALVNDFQKKILES
ncbi:acyltransferase [Vibrio navarrensis]|uniref:acyltransferase n=1 Tax=Vibrio navarrensis TaxID=29495 RepID=UPI0033900621